MHDFLTVHLLPDGPLPRLATRRIRLGSQSQCYIQKDHTCLEN